MEKLENTPCRFSDGFTSSEFEFLARKLGKKIKRITNIWIEGAVVYCIVESQHHISEWGFYVDFNDWGHVTGTFWTHSENHDSSIPHNFGMTLSRWIREALNEKNIHIRDLSDDVDSHNDLDSLIVSGISSRRGIFRYIADEFMGRKRQLSVNHAERDMKGEHLFPIFAQLMDNGFKNITTIEHKDVDDQNSYYIYEVEKVEIGGTSSFERGALFDYTAPVQITYHGKKVITIPFPVSSLKRQNYVEAGDRLVELGFTNIYERKIQDLKMGLITKDGSTETVVVKEESNEVPLSNNKEYPYDQPIVVCYHTFK